MTRNTLQPAFLLLLAVTMGALVSAGEEDRSVSRDADETSAQEPATICMEGSTTLGPIAEELAERTKKCRAKLKLTIRRTGSGNGMAALAVGDCDVAMMSRAPTGKEFARAVGKGVAAVLHCVAMDGVAVVVHPSNRVDALTIGQVRGIYAGEITNWKELGGEDRPILALSRDSSSGTFETFHQLVMKGRKMHSHIPVSASPSIHTRVAKTSGAVSYVGLGFVDEKVKAVKIDGVRPTAETIRTGRYPITRPLFLVTNGYPRIGSPVHSLVTQHLSRAGHKAIESRGFVPVTVYDASDPDR